MKWFLLLLPLLLLCRVPGEINPVRALTSSSSASLRFPGEEDSLNASPLVAGSFNPSLKPERGEIRIMWYNVENMFHPDDDTIAGDDEFTPEGVRRWSYGRYRKKLTAIAKVIVASGGWEPPELVGLCEVENALLLEELVQHPILAPYGYRFLHSDSPDRRGMDVACLYREKRIQLLGWKVYASESGTGDRGTRDMLHVSAVWGQRDSLDLFLVHLISKYSGAGFTAELRKRQVRYLVQLVDSVHQIRSNSLKVLAGDFNEVLEGYSMEPIRNGSVGGDPIRGIQLEGSLGSYKYRGRWSRIDQFLVCGRVGPNRFNGSILELPVVLCCFEVSGGIKPHRTYVGYLYNGGISDHLPALMDISGRPFSNGGISDHLTALMDISGRPFSIRVEQGVPWHSPP